MDRLRRATWLLFDDDFVMPVAAAYLHRLDGRLRLEQGDPAGGRAALQSALGLFAEMGITYEADITRGELEAVGPRRPGRPPRR